MIHFGWLNSIKAVIAPNLVTAFGVFLMRQYIVGGVPNELIAAARVDGCNSWRVFWHVILPAVRPMADYSLILTGCFISILPLLLVFLLLGRQIVGGIMQGAVKG
jgi:cellobiose transport system permease protein